MIDFYRCCFFWVCVTAATFLSVARVLIYLVDISDGIPLACSIPELQLMARFVFVMCSPSLSKKTGGVLSVFVDA